MMFHELAVKVAKQVRVVRHFTELKNSMRTVAAVSDGQKENETISQNQHQRAVPCETGTRIAVKSVPPKPRTEVPFTSGAATTAIVPYNAETNGINFSIIPTATATAVIEAGKLVNDMNAKMLANNLTGIAVKSNITETAVKENAKVKAGAALSVIDNNNKNAIASKNSPVNIFQKATPISIAITPRQAAHLKGRSGKQAVLPTGTGLVASLNSSYLPTSISTAITTLPAISKQQLSRSCKSFLAEIEKDKTKSMWELTQYVQPNTVAPPNKRTDDIFYEVTDKTNENYSQTWSDYKHKPATKVKHDYVEADVEPPIRDRRTHDGPKPVTARSMNAGTVCTT